MTELAVSSVNISVISWRSVLFLDETTENHMIWRMSKIHIITWSWIIYIYNRHGRDSNSQR